MVGRVHLIGEGVLKLNIIVVQGPLSHLQQAHNNISRTNCYCISGQSWLEQATAQRIDADDAESRCARVPGKALYANDTNNGGAKSSTWLLSTQLGVRTVPFKGGSG